MEKHPADFEGKSNSAKKWRIIALMFAYSASLGLIYSFISEDDRLLDLLLSIPMIILGVSWCYADASERHIQIGRLTSLALVLFFSVAFPIYLLRTRGIRGFATIFRTLLLAAGMFACIIATNYVTVSIGDAIGIWEAAQ